MRRFRLIKKTIFSLRRKGYVQKFGDNKWIKKGE